MSYIGRQLNNLSDRVKLDSITASATATYNLLLNSVAYVPSSAESLTVSLNGVIQAPQDSYTVSGSQITFASTLSASDSIDFILAERSITLQTPSAGSVGLTQLSATGTKDATTFLRGDNTFATVSSTTINNNADNRIITGSGTANTLEGESGLTFDGTTLLYSKDSSSVLKALEFKNLQTDSGAVSGVSFDFELNNSNANNPKAQIAVKEDANDGYATITFSTSPANNDSTLSEHMRINSSGNMGIGITNIGSSFSNGYGIQLHKTGYVQSNNNGGIAGGFGRSNDGTIINLVKATTTEGTISVSGGTVSYNSFAGSHWSRLADNSKPTILRGTVMESISTLMDWYQVEYTKDEETLTEYIGALPDGKSVGDSHTVTVDGVEYTGIISKEDNERLPKCKISDTEDSKAVYGVFMGWDNDDDTVNDMYITSLGAFVVRIHGDETVAIGDYLQSKGDGTAKVQADDILRASTIAKVTSTEKTHIYDDGSYCVPCTLHCG